MIIVVPAETPVTIPEVPILPVAGELLLQVPPPDTSLSAVDKPAQTCMIPDIAAGKGLTVMIVDAIQPVPKV